MAYLLALSCGIINALEITNREKKYQIYSPKMNQKDRKKLYNGWD